MEPPAPFACCFQHGGNIACANPGGGSRATDGHVIIEEHPSGYSHGPLDFWTRQPPAVPHVVCGARDQAARDIISIAPLALGASCHVKAFAVLIEQLAPQRAGTRLGSAPSTPGRLTAQLALSPLPQL